MNIVAINDVIRRVNLNYLHIGNRTLSRDLQRSHKYGSQWYSGTHLVPIIWFHSIWRDIGKASRTFNIDPI